MCAGVNLIRLSRTMESTFGLVLAAVVCSVWFSLTSAQELHRQQAPANECRGGGQGLRHVWGDALTDSRDCIGPEGMPYPWDAVARAARTLWGGNSRTGRSGLRTIDPAATQHALLEAWRLKNEDQDHARVARSTPADGVQCKNNGMPSRMCRTRYNTTAPMYGVSLTSGQPVTIVQKFPDLLQQVVFEVCESSECDVVQGQCTQTYVPYLFLVIPLGPVTLTGQDYVLVESGCVCKPKYASRYAPEANPISAIP